MLLKELDYKIPEKLIALNPQKPRDESKLVIVDKKFKIITFKNIIDFFNPNDALVFNDTKVIKANLIGFISKRKVSINLNKIVDREKVIWSVFIKSNKVPNINDEIYLSKDLKAKIVNKSFKNNFNNYEIKFNCDLKNFFIKIDKIGNVPLPPYITKKRDLNYSDSSKYQTVFATKDGAVAAPTASLHFSKKLLEKLKKKKIKLINITLHVNGGTFLPIKTQNVNDHIMHSEFGEITKKSALEINKIKKDGGKVVAIGTTVLRLLESSKDKKGLIKPFFGETNIFIKPGSKINTINGLITNFHTPKSSLLLLVIALLGEKKTKNLYEFAIKKKLRFFSYGDACLIWNINEQI